MQYEWNVKTEPTLEPITLAECKEHLRVDHTDDDDLITAYIQAARQKLELETGRAFYTQTRVQRLSQFPTTDRRIKLVGCPVQSITHVKYYDNDGTQSTWSNAEYALRVGEPNWLQLSYNYSWPDNRSDDDEIEIEYTCGKTDVADIEERVKQVIRMTVEYWYDDPDKATMARITTAIESLTGNLRIGEEFLSYGS
jgi:uncharacterized phiE125 gp8 family phage protein